MTKKEFKDKMKEIFKGKWDHAGPYTCNNVEFSMGYRAKGYYEELFNCGDYGFPHVRICFLTKEECDGHHDVISHDRIRASRAIALTIFENEVLETKAYKGF